ncbi:mechanosensitive ion channel family protein [Marinomonas gallaica]|uniref:mechanosensitive ion channel family protein n=1 Tax=Marinomonas gallaica TaxID=1806667 RepID=UPI003A8EE38E
MMDTLLAFYSTYEEQIFLIAKNVVLACLVVVMATFVSKLARRGVYAGAARLSQNDEIIAQLLSKIAAYAVYLIGLVIILDLFGVNTASLVALVGAAGLAVGLALKDTLSNIAAGIMILFLKPIKKGEYVEFNGYMGTVSFIGLFTSEFETADGLYISSPNSNVWNATIRNYSRNSKRRLEVTVGISYKDSIDTGMKVLLELASEFNVIMKDPAPQVIVHMLADSSVNLQLRAWTTPDKFWDTYWALQKQVKPRIEAAGLTIPFPQRDLHIIKNNELNENSPK